MNGSLIQETWFVLSRANGANSIPRGRRLDTRLGELVTRLLKDLTLFLSFK